MALRAPHPRDPALSVLQCTTAGGVSQMAKCVADSIQLTPWYPDPCACRALLRLSRLSPGDVSLSENAKSLWTVIRADGADQVSSSPAKHQAMGEKLSKAASSFPGGHDEEIVPPRGSTSRRSVRLPALARKPSPNSECSMNRPFSGHSDAVAFTRGRQGAICHDYSYSFLPALVPPKRDLSHPRRAAAGHRLN